MRLTCWLALVIVSATACSLFANNDNTSWIRDAGQEQRGSDQDGDVSAEQTDAAVAETVHNDATLDLGSDHMAQDFAAPPDGSVSDVADGAAEELPGTDVSPSDILPTDQAVPADVTEPAVGQPNASGAYAFTTFSAEVTQGTRKVPVKAYLPQGIAGPLPMVVFFPGFQLKAADYSGLLERLASHGFVVVGADPSASLLSTNHVEMAKDGKVVIDWALTQAQTAALVDSTRIGVSGHSLGGKVSVMLAFSDTRVKALLAIDPVNGGSPITGYSATLPDVVPEQVQPLTIPLGFAGETTNSSGGFQPCAPAAQNFETFYGAATSASWKAEWTFVGADHMDFLDNPNCGFTCSACTQGSADTALVKQGLWTLEVAFFRLHLAGESAMEPFLTGTSVPTGITVKTAQ